QERRVVYRTSTALNRIPERSSGPNGLPAAEMKATIFTWEFPPNIYGGAGVHAKYIATSLSKLIDVEVRTLEEGPPPDLPGLSVRRYRPSLKPLGLPDPKVAKAFEVLSFKDRKSTRL